MADQAEITAFGESEADLGSLCHKRRTRSPLFNLNRRAGSVAMSVASRRMRALTRLGMPILGLSDRQGSNAV